MSMDFTPELRRELLDDFYAESDELLTVIRQGLVLLISPGEEKVISEENLESLFRHTHTLKGISAIAGLRPAEELAHGMEDLFRALSRRQLPINAELVDILLAAVQRLEKVIAAHKAERALPNINAWLAELRQPLPASGKSTESSPVFAAEDQTDPVQTARERGLMIYLATFSPTRDLDQRGVNLNAIRERLAGLGEILRAKPTVVAKGVMVFEFTVGLRELPADLPTWEADGVRFVPLAASATAQPSAGGPAESETISLTPSHIVRVDLAKLDELMRITGEMVIHRSRMEDRLQQHGVLQAGLKDVNLGLSRSLRELREAITRIRMVPIAEIFARMPFVVRDLARASDKKVRVVLEGTQTEIDKYLVERLKEPLMHLVRNAFAHGIESAAERKAAGKAEEATITLRARSVGESVVIQIHDDGQGIDGDAVIARATAQGLKIPDRRDAGSVLQTLCAPGFSTREEADFAAGRGVGMAVVDTTVRELGGTLALKTERGHGTEFTLRLPLSLSIAEAIIVTVGEEIWAVPQSAVDEIIQAPAGDVRTINETEVLPYHDGLLPLVHLRRLFGHAPGNSPLLTLLVITGERGSTGLVVDRIRSQREIVIRRLSDPLVRVPGVAGAAELGDGRPILILDPKIITQGVIRPVDGATAPVETYANA